MRFIGLFLSVIMLFGCNQNRGEKKYKQYKDSTDISIVSFKMCFIDSIVLNNKNEKLSILLRDVYTEATDSFCTVRFEKNSKVIQKSYKTMGLNESWGGSLRLDKKSNFMFILSSYHSSGRAKTHNYYQINWQKQQITFKNSVLISRDIEGKAHQCSMEVNQTLDNFQNNYKFYVKKQGIECDY